MYRYPMTFIVAAVVYIFTFALPAPPSFAEGARLAVVAGNNHGGHERLPLRFAEEDARRMAGVLTGLGRADPEDVRLLQGSTPEDFLEAIEAAGRQAAASNDEASLIIVFYSGHADGENLLMGEERLGIRELKAAVEDLLGRLNR